jgi:hypothetical protein
MNNVISTYWFDNDAEGDYCSIVFDPKEERFSIKYYTADNKEVGEEFFPDHSLGYIEDAAENWAMGIKRVDFFNK